MSEHRRNGSMEKWISEKLDTWDLKSVCLTILVLFSFGFLFFYFADIRDRFRQADIEEFKGQTKGVIISVEAVDRINQSKWRGTEIRVDHYLIRYSYHVDGHKFQSIERIPLSTKNKKYLETV